MMCFRLTGVVFLLPILLLASLDAVADTQPEDRSVSHLLTVESLPPGFYTFSPDEYWLVRDDSYWTHFSNWVLGQHDLQSDRVRSLGEWADRTLSGNPRAAPNNESYLRIGLATESEYGDVAQFEPEARFKLDIPTVEEKLRLVIESESDELIPLSERRRDRQLTEDQRTETDATGALRYLSELSDHINLSNDIGARLRFPPDAFWRARTRGVWSLDENWRFTIDQRIYYFHVDGWGERTWLGFDRTVFDDWHFLSASEAAWVHSDRKFQLSQVFGLYKQLNNRAELNPRLGVLGESKPGWRTTDVFADVTYRYRLYDDWLYGEVIPTVEFPRSYHFKDRVSLILRIELYFSGNLNL
ncbi:hypothetical protein [Marinobacter caseinilyticus]|uniref:hypothetical protein n=1 Tax=Marinobacter caseinilyticus TaxID=2692195 RepID=UPI001F3E12F5|nr:hypothetical protein [Marinobacter caseinilyticus]